MEKIYLNVPYEEKSKAKNLGCLWDPKEKKWYTTNQNNSAIKLWPLPTPLPETLPGEDRELGNTLYIDLIPHTSWFTNVRSAVHSTEWDRVRNMIYKRANYTCETCGAKPTRTKNDYLEAHERWEYNYTTKKQILKRLIALCTLCHQTTHYGLSQIRGNAEKVQQHLMKTTGMTQAQVDEHIKNAYQTWEERNTTKWEVDISILTNAGIKTK